MRKEYKTTRSNGLGIFNLLGFAFAVILTVGFIKKSGVDFLENTSAYEYEEAELLASISALNPAERVPVNRNKTYKTENYTPSEIKARPKTVPARVISIEKWINDFNTFAKDQAMANGIPAGISLAMGITAIDAGIPIRSADDYMRAVVEPLTHLKKNAPYQDRSAYFKYAANSNLWAEGLGATGRYSSSDLKDLIARYKLDAFDKQVRSNIISAPSNSKPIVKERKIEYVASKAVKEKTIVAEAYEAKPRHAVSKSARAQEWKEEYNTVVGHEVAKEVARKKLKTGNYLTDEDMQQLIAETNVETEKALDNKLMFVGRKINKQHPKAKEALDITKAKNSQARGERYQDYLISKKQKNKN